MTESGSNWRPFASAMYEGDVDLCQHFERTTREGEGCRIEECCTMAVPGSRIKISNNILNLGRRGRGLDVSHRY